MINWICACSIVKMKIYTYTPGLFCRVFLYMNYQYFMWIHVVYSHISFGLVTVPHSEMNKHRIPIIMHKIYVLCFNVIRIFQFNPCVSGLLDRHWGDHTATALPVDQCDQYDEMHLTIPGNSHNKNKGHNAIYYVDTVQTWSNLRGRIYVFLCRTVSHMCCTLFTRKRSWTMSFIIYQIQRNHWYCLRFIVS